VLDFVTVVKLGPTHLFLNIHCVPTHLVPRDLTPFFYQLHLQYHAYWRGAKPRDFTLTGRSLRMVKEWINRDLNMNLTAEYMDQRGDVFERIVGVPQHVCVCWFMHCKSYSQ
jgi:hypothetical protein